MLGFLKKLLGGGAGADAQAAAADPVEHQGYTIVPVPRKEDSGFRVAGLIRKEVDGEMREYSFVRADVYYGYDDAVQVIVQKAERIIAEQGERIFEAK